MNDNVYSSPMDFRLSDDQLAFQRHCHAFARDVMRPAAPRYDREQAVPHDVIREARACGTARDPAISSGSAPTRRGS